MMLEKRTSPDVIKKITFKLLRYCRSQNWAGHDPYDALNSKIIQLFPMLNSEFPRLALTQLMKRAPINFRSCLGIEKTQNPKALAIFLKALVNLHHAGLLEDGDILGELVERLDVLRAKDSSYYCWGYSFPWQSKSLLVPRGSPNIVCTAFVASALLDVYDLTRDQNYLNMAKSVADYVVNDLYWEGDDQAAGFGYPSPSTHLHIHNANLLGAALLCRVFDLTKEVRLLDCALKVARYSAHKQNADGSWFYGELPRQKWIDNFHTGYNLLALREIDVHSATTEFAPVLQKGYDFYCTHFFRSDGAPKYFHDRVYPIDIHSAAQGIITLVELKDLYDGSSRIARSVLDWAILNMWNNNGYFYYQKKRLYTVRTPFMRWSEAWMLLALTTYIRKANS